MTDLTPIIAAVQDAAKLCRTIQAGGMHAASKNDDSPVTIADYGAQALICRAIQTHFPGDAVIAEEGGAAFQSLVSERGQAQLAGLLRDIIGQEVTPGQISAWLDYGQGLSTARTWVIDPIDGTVGFVNNRYYAICVATLENHRPTCGIIGLPRSPIDTDGSIIYTDGTDVFAMNMNGDDQRQVRASGRRDNLLIMESYKLSDEEMAHADRVRAAANLTDANMELYDSQLKYAMIAAGYGDLFVRLPRDVVADPHKLWDHAPGAALLRAAGAIYTDVDGHPVDFSVGTTLPHTGFVVTNGDEDLHTLLVAALKRA